MPGCGHSGVHVTVLALSALVNKLQPNLPLPSDMVTTRRRQYEEQHRRRAGLDHENGEPEEQHDDEQCRLDEELSSHPTLQPPSQAGRHGPGACPQILRIESEQPNSTQVGQILGTAPEQ